MSINITFLAKELLNRFLFLIYDGCFQKYSSEKETVQFKAFKTYVKMRK